MKYLLDNTFAPVTFTWGFIELALDHAAKSHQEWLRSLKEPSSHELATVTTTACLKDHLLSLFPVSTPPRRELMITTRGSWTAYFDNSSIGGNAASAVGYLSSQFGRRGIAVECIPHRSLEKGRG